MLTSRPGVLELQNRPSPIYSALLFSIEVAVVVVTVGVDVVDVVVTTTSFSN